AHELATSCHGYQMQLIEGDRPSSHLWPIRHDGFDSWWEMPSIACLALRAPHLLDLVLLDDQSHGRQIMNLTAFYHFSAVPLQRLPQCSHRSGPWGMTSSTCSRKARVSPLCPFCPPLLR